MSAAGDARSPGGLLAESAGLEVIAVEFVEPGPPQAQSLSRRGGLDPLVAEKLQHMADQRRSTALGQLGSFRFSNRDRSKIGGRCPPDPLGFFALGLLQQGGKKNRRAVVSPPVPNPAVRKPPDRRSGRIPALPYPPLERPKNISLRTPNKAAQKKSGFDRTSGFANYKLSAFANYSRPVLIAPRHVDFQRLANTLGAS
jgi:hypothetical protein